MGTLHPLQVHFFRLMFIFLWYCVSQYISSLTMLFAIFIAILLWEFFDLLWSYIFVYFLYVSFLTTKSDFFVCNIVLFLHSEFVFLRATHGTYMLYKVLITLLLFICDFSVVTVFTVISLFIFFSKFSSGVLHSYRAFPVMAFSLFFYVPELWNYPLFISLISPT